MRKKIRVYTDDEVNTLLKNPYVISIKNKVKIVYSDKFKLWAVEEKIKYPEKNARTIFSEAGFDIDILDYYTPIIRLYEWKKKYLKFGLEYFLDNNKENYKSLASDERKNV